MKKLLLSSAVLLSTVFVTACSQNQASTDVMPKMMRLK